LIARNGPVSVPQGAWPAPDLWFRQGMAGILASVDLANQNGPAGREMDDHAAAYRQGFRDCLQAVDVAFG